MIKIVCAGKLKEKYLVEAVEDYKNRINKYHKLEIIEIPDSNIKEEAKAIKKAIKEKDYLITLEIEGQQLTSLELSNKINSLFIQGISDIVFIIGESDGLHEEVKQLSNFKLSFSKLTFPHGLFRVILLEQIYRSFKIINNEKYHK